MRKQRVHRHEVSQPLDQSYKLIPLTQGQNAKVSTEDFEWLNQWNWHACWDHRMKCFTVRRHNHAKPKSVTMARQILGCEDGELADHVNHDTLDNRRKNLRKASSQQNCFNRKPAIDNKSKYKGVTKNWNKWGAHIMGKRIIGNFSTPEEAAKAYDKKAKELFGEF